MNADNNFEFYKQVMAEKTQEVLDQLEKSFKKISIGAPNPQLVSHIKVDFYDSLTPINEIASITAPAPLQLLIKPYEISLVKSIATAITQAKIDAQVQKEANQVRLLFPEPTFEKRQENIILIKKQYEEAKIKLRLVRQNINKMIKKEEFPEDLEKKYLEQIQRKTDGEIAKLEQIYEKKVKETQAI